jgi:hypothetical protein
LIESIGIGGDTERADKKAKHAGSRFSEMFVVASKLRSLIAGVSAMGAAFNVWHRAASNTGSHSLCRKASLSLDTG